MPIKLELPNAQINFAKALTEIRSMYLQDALAATMASMEIDRVDSELHDYVDNNSLQALARHGMRGELLFVIPSVLEKNPRLLGYYRLLLGYSQKGFYCAATGAGMFKSLETKGKLSAKQRKELPTLCNSLNKELEYMLEHFDTEMISALFFDQLTLLTLGPQLRGKANVQKGTSAIADIFNVVFQIVRPSVTEADPRRIVLRNNSDRIVYIQFSADPDIVIREELAPELYKNLVAIEVKGGQDFSNIHNRIGEAEKSHQKAKKDGYVECWTVVNVDNIDMSTVLKESPTTNRLYHISALLDKKSDEYKEFSLQICSIVGI